MRELISAGLGLLALAPWLGCGSAAPFTSRRLSYGTYELTCKLPLPKCLDHVEEICRGTAYDVLGAHDRRVTRQDRGFQNDTQSSDATIRCDLTKPLFGGDATPIAPPVAAVAAPAPNAPVAPRACIPGATQACVGPAACAGGQACRADGVGFGPCDCGTPGSPPANGPN